MTAEASHDPDWELTAEQTQALRETGTLGLFLDVRTPSEVDTASIDHAHVLEMQELPQRLSEIESHRDEKVVVFCHGGVRSLKVVEFLRKQGFSDAWSMQGGIHAWSLRIDPSVPKY